MPRAASSPSRTTWRASVLPLGLALVAVLTYVRALPNPFVYDDVRTVVTNPSLTDLSNWRRILLHDVKRPLVNLTYAFDRAGWGLDPRGFHATSALLHGVAVVLLFAWTRQVIEDAGRDRPVHLCARCAAGAAALFFAVHPAMTQAVGYVSGRPEVLCAVWFLAALLLLRRYVLGGRLGALAFGVLAWVLALASKEVGAMLPFVLAAWASVTRLRSAAPRRRARLLLLATIGVGMVAGVWRVLLLWTVENPGEGRVFWAHLLVKPEILVRYLRLLVAPARLSVFHAVTGIDSLASARFVGPLAICAALGAMAWLLRRREPVVAFGLAWFLLLVVPSGVLFVVNLGEPMAEQRLYLASCGVFMIAGTGTAWLRAWLRDHRPRLAWVAPAIVVVTAVVLFAATEVRLGAWSSPVRLWADAERKAPGAWVPPLMLGDALDAEGRTHEAIDAYRRAASLRDDQPVVWLRLGTLLMQVNDLDGATAAYREALERDPHSTIALNALGAVAIAEGRPDEARSHLEASLGADPGNVPARLLLAALAERAGRREDALRWCREVERLAPGTPGASECIARDGGTGAPAARTP